MPALRCTDWYAPQWLAAALLILILCVADALITLALLGHGAHEANPLMDTIVHGDGRSFVAFKFGLTATGVVLLILLARVRAFGRLPVSMFLYSVLAGIPVPCRLRIHPVAAIRPRILLAQAWVLPV